MRRFTPVLLVLVCSCEEPRPEAPAGSVAVAAPAASDEATPVPAVATRAAAPVLDAGDRAALREWFEEIGDRREGEGFGDLVVRAARHQLQKPYDGHRQVAEHEVLHIDLTRFQCVSFVESSLAVARCVWRGQTTDACFLADVEASRYRGGRLTGYASRLHYFPDWMADNEERGRVAWVTPELGGVPQRYRFTFMSDHPGLYPPLASPEILAQIESRESDLSHRDWIVIERDRVAAVESHLQNGDIVALVSDRKPGLFVGHTGFVDKSPKGVPRLLHASSHHKRVLLTAYGVATYVQGRPYRRGIMVARPLPPP